ncbi:hypothetical protein K488DRAFT_86605 [Vararia minispora EC-137]|uniref:Uncharacterized protein n=1 Tax=Vararia minispora EC-137 TaxID=1314806 RepID=A0ACB8QJ78_9AGAM|nr:hypothetical protein K488DRAFT_86605 [Vararia minispora EC-137]
MPRENSFSDEGRSLTPDLDDDEVAADARSASNSHKPARPQPAPVQISSAEGHDHHQFSTSKQPAPSLASKKSLRSRISFNRHPQSAPPPALAGSNGRHASRFATSGDRFRSVVHRVMAMHRTSYMLSGAIVGAEPGIDPRRAATFQQYGHIRQKCIIDIFDYSSLRVVPSRMSNAELVAYLRNEESSRRPPWAKVRWINVGGLSWDVVSELAIKYDMHPLAVEDLLHQSDRARSKADYHVNHLFLRVLCHSVGSGSRTDDASGITNVSSTAPTWSSRAPTLNGVSRTMSPAPLDEKKGAEVHESEEEAQDERAQYDFEAAVPRSATLLARRRKNRIAQLTLEELKRGDRVDVHLSPMCIFLYEDGTVISFVTDSSLDFTEPIANRLRQRDSTLRRTADPALLVQSLLDIIVDRALEVVDEYHRRIQELERDVLLRAQVKSVRALHILSADLTLHKRTMEPIRALVYGLRRYDADRYAAVRQTALNEGTGKRGYMSHKSIIYLADVYDHTEYALASLDMYAALTENLIAYAFNMASYEMNQTMRSLTLVTIIFFPLTLLTGYFGMNFQGGFWSIHNNSDLFFWELAIPIMSVVIPIFLWQDFLRVFRFGKKKLLARRIKKAVKTPPPSKH